MCHSIKTLHLRCGHQTANAFQCGRRCNNPAMRSRDMISIRDVFQTAADSCMVCVLGHRGGGYGSGSGGHARRRGSTGGYAESLEEWRASRGEEKLHFVYRGGKRIDNQICGGGGGGSGGGLRSRSAGGGAEGLSIFKAIRNVRDKVFNGAWAGQNVIRLGLEYDLDPDDWEFSTDGKADDEEWVEVDSADLDAYPCPYSSYPSVSHSTTASSSLPYPCS